MRLRHNIAASLYISTSGATVVKKVTAEFSHIWIKNSVKGLQVYWMFPIIPVNKLKGKK